MKKYLLSAIVSLFALPLSAAPLGDFGNPALWEVMNAEKRGQSLSRQPLPDGSGTGLHVTWDGRTFAYAELHLRKPLPLPEEFRQGVISLRLRLPAKAPIRSINLRLVDATGETFQFQLRYLPLPEAGVQVIDYPVDLAKRENASWGGNNDKKMDLPVSLRGFSIDFERESDAGEALFIGADVAAKIPSAADNIRLEVETGTPVRVLRAGEEGKLNLRFRNAGSERYRGDAEVEFRDFYDRVFSEKVPSLDLAPGAEFTLPVKAHPPAFGHWSVRARLATPGQNPVTLTRSFAYLEPAGPTPGRAEGFLWGISSHPQLHPAPAQELEALAAALVGAKVVREDIYWHRVQPARDQWNFNSFDQTVSIFAKQGIELQAILCYTAPWAARNPAIDRPDKSEPEPEAWSRFCFEMAKRYRGKVRFWEVWNEPDVTPFSRIDSTRYAEMMKSAYRAVKSADPEAVVLTGGFATLANHPMLREPDYQEQALKKGKGAFDIHAYHEHGPFYPHFYRMVEERFLPMRQRTGTTQPWWANETALTSAGGNERPQAEALYKKLLFAWGRGAVGYNWYDLRNDGDNPNHGEQNYGMLTRDFYPKPVYAVYNTLVTLFRGKEFERQLEAGALDWLLLFRDKDELLLAAWSEQRAALPVVIRTDAKSAEAVDLMNNRRPVPVHDGRILLEVGQTPVTLRLAGATRTEFAGNPVKPEGEEIAVPGRSYRFAVQLTNPLTEAAEFRLAVRAPAGFLPEKLERKITVSAGGKTAAPFELRVDPAFRPVFGVPVNLSIDYQLGGTDYRGRVEMPVHVSQVIPFSDPAGRPADFLLNRWYQIYELFPTDPSKAHLLWKGPRDLSAQVWLGTRKNALLLRVLATDDRHHQPERGANVWMGDSVQFGLELPGRKGHWEFGLSRLADGAPEVWCWAAPDGRTATAAAAAVKLTTTREGTVTGYEAEIPFAAIGLTEGILREGFRFNLLINDNDGEGRKNWIGIAPGIGESKDPAKYPFVIFK